MSNTYRIFYTIESMVLPCGRLIEVIEKYRCSQKWTSNTIVINGSQQRGFLHNTDTESKTIFLLNFFYCVDINFPLQRKSSTFNLTWTEFRNSTKFSCFLMYFEKSESGGKVVKPR